jgi:ribosomal-protein-alanine N-acetyltransferase
MSVKIDKCAPCDFPLLERIEKENMENPWTEAMIKEANESGDYLFLKAISGDKIVGYLSARLCIDECELNNIAVDRESRRNGVGTLLLSALESECKKGAFAVIFLEVNEKNTVARKLYLKNGFSEMSRRKRYYGDDDAIILTKKL